MANGDAAAAAGMDKMLGTADRRLGFDEINKTRDYIADRTNAITPVAKGGTGSSTPAGARTALEITAANVLTGGGASSVQADITSLNNVKLTRTSAEYSADFASRDSAIGARVAKTGDSMSGDLYLPNSSAANSGFTIAYINGDGRVSRGSSSVKYKKYITAVDPATLGDIFPQLDRFKMRSQGPDAPSDETWNYGHLAEHLAEHPDQAPFVVIVNGEIESIDFISLLLAQTAQLHQRLRALEERLTKVEGDHDS